MAPPLSFSPRRIAHRTPRAVRWGIGLGIGIVVVVSSALRFSPVRAVPIRLVRSLPLAGPLAVNERLRRARRIPIGRHTGPEDVAPAPDGSLIVGTEDGELLRVRPFGDTVDVIARTEGRPLGLKFGNDGTLFIADAYRGLLLYDGKLTLLADRAGGGDIGLADDLDVAGDGTVYFSDASTGWTLADFTREFLEGRPYGRLLRWRAGGGAAEVLLDGLAFANGVALSADESFVLINETLRARVWRYWLRGPRRGVAEVWLDGLPGLPDGIARAGDGSFWLAVVLLRDSSFDRLANRPLLRALLADLPESWMPRPTPYGLAIHIAADGRILESLHDPQGTTLSFITNVVPAAEGTLYFGSLYGDAVGMLKP